MSGIAHPLQKLLEANPQGVARLLAQTRELTALAEVMARGLSPHLLSHCRLANLRGGILVLQADSPVWASRLRYSLPALIEHLQGHGWPQVKEARVRVKPPLPPALPGRRAVMSDKTGTLLKTVAAACTDPEMAAAWRRLSRHGAPGTGQPKTGWR